MLDRSTPQRIALKSRCRHAQCLISPSNTLGGHAGTRLDLYSLDRDMSSDLRFGCDFQVTDAIGERRNSAGVCGSDRKNQKRKTAER